MFDVTRPVRVLLALLAMGSVTAQAAQIQFKTTATCQGPMILLSDVADIRCVDETLNQQLHKVQLGPAPATGTTRPLEFSEIRSQLVAQGVNLAQIELTGSSLIRVTGGKLKPKQQPMPKPTVLSPQHQQAVRLAEDALWNYLRRRLPSAGSFELNVHIDKQDVPYLLAANSKLTQVSGGIIPYDGKQQFRFGLMFNNGATHALQISADVERSHYLLVARTNLRLSQTVQAQDLGWKKFPIKTTGETSPENLIGRPLRRMVKKDQPIHETDLRKRILINPNDLVTVYTVGNGFRVQRTFKARSRGSRGDRIQLVSATGRETVTAEVIGPKLAEIKLPSRHTSIMGQRTPTPRTGIKFVPAPATPSDTQPVKIKL